MMLPQLTSAEQAAAQMKFNEWNCRKDVVVLDTETTGLYDAEICEVSVIDLEGKVLFDSLVRPIRPIPEEARAIHGITDEMVRDAPTWDKVWNELKIVLNNKLILIYNAEFDSRLMVESFDSLHMDESVDEIRNLEIDCVMKTYASLIGSDRWVKLSVAAGYETEHRALGDCRATREVIISNYRPEIGEDEAAATNEDMELPF